MILLPEYIGYAMHGIDQINVGIYILGTCLFRNVKYLSNVEISILAKKNADEARNNGTAQFKHCRIIVEIVPQIESILQEVVVCIATTMIIAIPRIKSK